MEIGGNHFTLRKFASMDVMIQPAYSQDICSKDLVLLVKWSRVLNDICMMISVIADPAIKITGSSWLKRALMV